MNLRFDVLVVGVFGLFAATRPMGAQANVAPWARVRVALSHDTVVEGRVAGGDSAWLKVRASDGRMIAVRRDSIWLLTTTSTFTRDQVFPTAVLAGVASAFLLGSVSAHCRAVNRCGMPVDRAELGGAVGLSLGALIAGAFAADKPNWRASPATARVRGQSAGMMAPESCDPYPSVQVESGISGAGSSTDRLAVTASCYKGFSIGGEMGTPRRLGDERYVISDLQNQSKTTQYSHAHRATFRGGFAEMDIPGIVFNPRIIASAGRYHREDRSVTEAWTYSYNPYSSAQAHTDTKTASDHMGAGLGMSVSFPCLAHVSIGFEARSHLLFGDGGGMINTIGTFVRVRR